jgi:FkbH-like protein
MITYDKILEYIETIKSKNYKTITVLFLSNFNNFVLNNYLTFNLGQSNLKTKFIKSEYDQINQEIFNLSLNKKINKINYLIIGYDINSKLNFGEFLIEKYINNIKNNIDEILNNKSLKNVNIIHFNLSLSENIFFYPTNDYHIFLKKINSFNKYLNRICNIHKNHHILDVNKLINQIGINNFYNSKNYYLYKTPYTELTNNVISHELSNIINSTLETNKKCLVLDLDNTLWGGVLGETGSEGIDLGKTYRGQCFKNFQKYLKVLLKKGIILAACSKNNIGDVKECFKKNKDMILKLRDFSALQINWNNKYKNIDLVANELNIGKDAIVFFDDSPLEREEMKNFNPQINVIDVPQDPENFIQSIEKTSFFFKNKQTVEDIKKRHQYEILKKARNLKTKFRNINDFYKSLKMTLEISNINKHNFERSVQLINKTNQFNLTSRRYTESKLEVFLKSKSQFTFVGRLKDKFGDHGITALAMIKKSENTWIIDNFLLSCRILGRKIENVFLHEILKKLRFNKISSLQGTYIETNKNSQCKNFYIDNNFKKIKNNYFIILKNLKKLNERYIKIKYE